MQNKQARSMATLPITVVLSVGMTPSLSAAQRAPAADDIERRIDALISKLTLEEKLGQMSQKGFPDGLPADAKDQIRKGRWGSFYNGGTQQEKAEAQRIAREESRLGIPLIYGQDAIHGFRTVFPIPLGQAASWNPELIESAARATAHEASGVGIHWTFAPMLDVSRDPRWGRIAESLGEDPYLTGQLGAAMVRGFQGHALSAVDSIAACGKHFVGYGAAEGGRDYDSTWIPEPLLRDVYLVPFHAVCDAGIASYMSAFNSINGVPASGNEFTLREVLRNEWKFDGVVVSDFKSVTEMIAHGYAADEQDAALKGIAAGVNMEMISTSYVDHGAKLVESGALDMKLIDDAVRNILRLKFRVGLFDGKPQPVETPIAHEPEALDVARTLAAESLVLLKNKGAVLPLSSSVKKVAVIGPLADSPADQLGTWAMGGDHEAVQTPLAALRKLLGADRVIWAPGVKGCEDPGNAGFPDAVNAAKDADVVVMFLGESAIMSGEASCRAFLDLPGAQQALVDEVAKTGKPIVAVILSGRPLTFNPLSEKAAAVLFAWHPGTMGGPAIADVLFGKTVPTGRLPVSFPRTVGQIPTYYNRLNTGRPIIPGVKDHFTAHYQDVDISPEYPFGFGLSYTEFKYAGLKVSEPGLRAGETLTVSAEIANTGSHPGDEVVQCYIRDRVASISQPIRRLVAFQRLHFNANETRKVEFQLTTEQLGFHNAQGKLVTEPGDFDVWIAPNAAAGEPATFKVLK